MKKLFALLSCFALAIVTAFSLTSCGKEKLIVATNAEFPPFEYDGGEKGFDMDFIRAYGEYVGKEIEIQDVEFDAALLAVQNGKADIAIAGITKNSDREKVMTFTNAYYNSNQVVTVKNGSELATAIASCTTDAQIIAALEGKNIGVQRGTTGQYYVEGDADWDFAGITGATCKAYDNGGLAMKDLNDGKIDAVILDEAPSKSIVGTKYTSNLTIANIALTEEEYAIAVKLGNTELANSLNEFIALSKTNGKYDDLLAKYF